VSTLMETRVAGIPCTARIDYVNVVKGSYNYHAASDHDYHGYSEIDWELCDRRGRPAPWLAKKLTADDVARIENEILEWPSND
jgi:hypothetical protein